MARAELESRFPGVLFVDPGTYCSGLLDEDSSREERKLTMKIKGDVVSRTRVSEFAKSYLGSGFTGL